MSPDNIYELLGFIVTWLLSGTAGAALFAYLGRKWFENKMAKDLESFKASKLHELDFLLNRKIKWHQNEYEVLSTSWIKIIKARRALGRCVGMFRSIPDLNRMDESDFKRFLEANIIEEDEKAILEKSDQKSRNTEYLRILNYRDLIEANKLFFEFHEYFEENKIFLPAELKQVFSEIDKDIWSVIIDRKMSIEDNKISYMKEALKTVNEKINPLMLDIENIVQSKLLPN